MFLFIIIHIKYFVYNIPHFFSWFLLCLSFLFWAPKKKKSIEWQILSLIFFWLVFTFANHRFIWKELWHQRRVPGLGWLLFSCQDLSNSSVTLWTIACRLAPSVHGIFQARTLKQVAISFSRGSSCRTEWICVSCSGRQIPYHWANRETPGLGLWLLVLVSAL